MQTQTVNSLQHRTEKKHDPDKVGLKSDMLLTRWRQTGGSSPEESTGIAVMLFNIAMVSWERQALYWGLKTWTMIG